MKANRGAGGVDGEGIEAFDARSQERLSQTHEELKAGSYQPLPVRQKRIPKVGRPNEQRMLGIAAIYDRVCQQALVNRLEPIFEPVFDAASFGRWRSYAWRQLPVRRLYGELQLVRLRDLIPSQPFTITSTRKLRPGNPHTQFERWAEASARLHQARLPRPD